MTWSEPTVSDNSGSVSLVFNSHDSGNTFGPGENTITYIYQDPYNNRGQCTFTITILECKFLKRCFSKIFCELHLKCILIVWMKLYSSQNVSIDSVFNMLNNDDNK